MSRSLFTLCTHPLGFRLEELILVVNSQQFRSISTEIKNDEDDDNPNTMETRNDDLNTLRMTNHHSFRCLCQPSSLSVSVPIRRFSRWAGGFGINLRVLESNRCSNNRNVVETF